MKKNKLDLAELNELSRICKGDILKMTTLAQSGHPGGSMSSLDLYLALYSFANISPDNVEDVNRDRIIISHGHTAPGVYSVLGRFGFFNIDDAIAYFRKAGSIFEGHVEPSVPGIEWATGNLGQGLSAGCGFALAGKQRGLNYKVFVVMGDGEQQKGQISEARRFVIKYGLNNITVLIDYNRLQISGKIIDVMPQNIKGNYLSDGWKVIETDGHNFEQIFSALEKAKANKSSPTAILAHTIMGNGVSFMENDAQFHGKALNESQCEKALNELNVKNDLDKYKNIRESFIIPQNNPEEKSKQNVQKGKPKIYDKDKRVANRDAYGYALADLVRINKDRVEFAVFDCDLAGSVKTNKFAKENPTKFYQGGIQEHNTAVIAGAMSKEGIITFYSDFGVFGVDETYNQQRLNDINHTNLKLVTTHVGLDVGEDGKTHQCIDYIGVMRNLFGFKIIIPADANQTDRVIRYIASEYGNFLVPIGRSKTDIVLAENDDVFYDENYKFQYGKSDRLRDGDDATIIATGVMVEKALKVYEILKSKGINISVWNLSCVSDISKEDLESAASTGYIFTYEDHNVNTGLGSIVSEKLVEFGIQCKLVKFGVTRYGISGRNEEVYRIQGLDLGTVAKKIEYVFKNS
ncbi:MAG: transketolase [Candidatus Cloacimonadota bacterium]|nr:transketolase [Candidatus Cloacimonadota bacterium]